MQVGDIARLLCDERLAPRSKIAPGAVRDLRGTGALAPAETMALWSLYRLIETAELCTDSALQKVFLVVCTFKVRSANPYTSHVLPF